ncbi:YlaH-like family protein [Halalkalibacterium halodurans]|uniref:BH2631 protein n=1 Tax=Halalkalibacterium halodurans (strain ATCC BAA-125 / DSM 18197 / FERM 7344 / JCM 9153 / C-125) TaxID=272558 RepID=Q9K9L4_HALH5|nr:YlaH-like family protein [Halalkalibacterium halodurans]MED3647727.1 YlaH-like family protein [Halalkalibacterium halodurans]MED4173432.1 YlaH-like family protein [Halalkalibacterium halodurans]TES56004.1 hypothetical protein E2L07_06060 [Halalkalibacterium halodurans]BAB06350.1 BH2631 [Halalkalibacterium halodurans C-125]
MAENRGITEADLETMSWMMRATVENPWFGFLGYLLIIVLAILVFNLGFARKLSPLKTVIVYTLLIIGCFVLWFLEFFFSAPMTLVLIISSLVLGAYRFRLHKHRKKEQSNGPS